MDTYPLIGMCAFECATTFQSISWSFIRLIVTRCKSTRPVWMPTPILLLLNQAFASILFFVWFFFFFFLRPNDANSNRMKEPWSGFLFWNLILMRGKVGEFCIKLWSIEKKTATAAEQNNKQLYCCAVWWTKQKNELMSKENISKMIIIIIIMFACLSLSLSFSIFYRSNTNVFTRSLSLRLLSIPLLVCHFDLIE